MLVLPPVPIPPNNPQTAAKIELGAQLYFDPRLSVDNTISCASCHNPATAGQDNKAFSLGVKGQLGGRSSPSVYLSGYFSALFWDARADTLEDQAKGPLTNPVEMGMPHLDAVVTKVAKIPGYEPQFVKVFNVTKDKITIDHIAMAIASFERTLVTGDSPFDKFEKGDKKALSAEAQEGYKKFKETGCTSCHSGPLFAGPQSRSGVAFSMKFPTFPNTEFDKKYQFSKDLGRFNVTKKEADKHVFRVPSLRNIAKTAPYFHNGAVATLPEAVRVMGKIQLNKDLADKDVTLIVAFLESLTGTFPAIKPPALPQ